MGGLSWWGVEDLFCLCSHLSSVIIFERNVNLEMGKQLGNSDNQLSGCWVPATGLRLSRTTCLMVRRFGFLMGVLLQELGYIAEKKDSSLKCLSHSRPHLDSALFQNTDGQRGSYLRNKYGACSQCGWKKQVSPHEEVSTAKDEAQLWAGGHSVAWLSRGKLPGHRKGRHGAGFPGSKITEWIKASELKGVRQEREHWANSIDNFHPLRPPQIFHFPWIFSLLSQLGESSSSSELW